QSLEEAFIGYIEEAIGEMAPGDDEAPPSLSPEVPVNSPEADHSSLHRFSLARLLAYSYRELIEVMRDPVRLAFAFLGTTILLIVISYGISTDVDNLNYAALDLDRTPQSRDYLRDFSGSRYFLEQPEITSRDELEKRLKSNDITLGIEIPSGFGRELKRGGTPEVSAWIDGANTTRAGTIEGYVSGGHAVYLTRLARNAGVDLAALLPANVEPRYRYNPSFESIYAVGPSAPGLLLLLFPAILMAVSIAREKEIGTITNFYVTPTNRLEFLIGKQLPYIGIGMANFVILTLVVLLVLQVPMKGSFLALAAGAFLYVAASTGFGLLVSSMTKSQVAAVFATAILSMLPTMQFSGMIQPVSTLEGGGRLIGSIWPTTYYIHLSVGAFTKGLNFGDLTPDLLALAAFAPIFLIIATVLLKKQEV
ncbi:MAG: ABC transporter permease, partial [Rhizobiaceae bacterium]